MPEAPSSLDELATSISDGEPIDWDTWERVPRDVSEQAVVRSLRRISEIASACRTFQREAGEAPPSHWGHLEILETVGRGASSDVFRARDPRVGREVALKLLRQKRSESPDGIIGEAHLLAKVKHPNVATIYGADERDGRVGIWMEFLEGPTLQKKLQQEGPFSANAAARIGADVCRALEAVHAVGVLHRDVKAANIVLQDGERSVLMDFGVGVEVEGPPLDVRGTPLYLAPEVFGGAPQTIASDLYSVGVLLYFLVTGDFPLVADDAETLERAHREGALRPLKDHSPPLPEEFARVVDRALSPAPEARYRTAGDMANALETVVETLERPRPRSARFVLAALALGAALLALAYLYGPAGGVPPGSEILVAAIDNRTGDETLDAIQTLLETELRQSPRFELVDDKRIGSALNRMGRASPELSDRKSSQEVAWRLAVPLVLTGTLQPVGSGYRLSLQLHMLGEASPTPTASWARDFTARDENEIYETVDAAGRWIRKTAGERRASIAQLDFPVREMTTPSWEALDLFYQAEELKQKDRWQDAILLLEEAVEADPDFAVAQMRLGDLKSSLKEVESYGHWERALDSLRRRRVSRREELNIRALYAIDTGSYLEAEPLYRKLSLLYPGDYRAAYYHGLTLRVLARYREALDRLLDAERKSPEPMYHVLVQIAGAHLALDDPSGASLYAEKLRAIDAPGWADAIQGAERFLRGEHEEAEAAFRGMTEGADLTMASWGYSLLAAALSERGRFDEAADALGRGIELDVKSGRPSTRAAKLLDLAQVLALQGKAEQARAACLQALELERGPHQMAIAGPLLARAGFPDDARNLLPELKPHRDKPLYRRAELLIEGEVHVARRKPGLALQVLHEAAALDRPEPKLYLARALRAAGHLEEAAAAYEEIVRSEGLVWMKRICDRPYPPGFFATALEEYAETAESVRLLNDQAARARERLLALRPDPGR